MNSGDVSAKADEVGRSADDSDLLDHAVRVGLVAYGVVHLLIAWVAVSLAFGRDEGSWPSYAPTTPHPSRSATDWEGPPLGRATKYYQAELELFRITP